MINTILFDMDGVLVDSEPLFINRSINVLEHFGFNYDIKTLISCIGTSYDETNRILSKMINQDLPVSYSEIETTLCPIDSIDYKQYKIKGLDQLLDYIKAQGFKTAVCSSSPIETIQIILKSLELDTFFDVILTGEVASHTNA